MQKALLSEMGARANARTVAGATSAHSFEVQWAV